MKFNIFINILEFYKNSYLDYTNVEVSSGVGSVCRVSERGLYTISFATLVKVDAAGYNGRQTARVLLKSSHAVSSSDDMVIANNCTAADMVVVYSEGHGVGKLAGKRILSSH